MLQHKKQNYVRMLVICLMAAFCCVSCNQTTKQPEETDTTENLNWHLPRGNTGLNAFTKIKIAEKPGLLWTYKSGVRTVSSPVVDNGTTYWCDGKGTIHGVDIHGRPVFRYELKTSVEATPLINDSVMYIGRIDGKLTAISLAKKDTLWNFSTEGQISATPNITRFKDQTAIIVGSYDTYMYCIDAVTGKFIKKFPTGYYLNGAAALWNKYVVFGGCDAWVRMVDTETGETTDSLKTQAYIPGSPAIMRNDCYIGDYSGNVYEMSLSNGKIATHKKLQTAGDENGAFLSAPAVNKDFVCFFSDNRTLISINRKTKASNWKFRLKGNAGESAPLICKDKIIVCTKTGIVSIIEAATGKIIWEYDTGETIVASPAVIKDHFLILTNKGTLFCFGDKQQN